MSKNKSAETGRFVTAKAAKAKPRTTFAVNDYPARMLRKLVRLILDPTDHEGLRILEISKLIASIKKRMKWK